MSTKSRQVPVDDPEAALLAKVYAAILAWPCPKCGQAWPCLHDLPPVVDQSLDDVAGTGESGIANDG